MTIIHEGVDGIVNTPWNTLGGNNYTTMYEVIIHT